MEPRTIATLLTTVGYPSYFTRSLVIFRCSCHLRYIFDNRGCDISPRDGVNLIISLFKLVYINLLLLGGLAVLPRGIFIDFR